MAAPRAASVRAGGRVVETSAAALARAAGSRLDAALRAALAREAREAAAPGDQEGARRGPPRDQERRPAAGAAGGQEPRQQAGQPCAGQADSDNDGQTNNAAQAPLSVHVDALEEVGQQQEQEQQQQQQEQADGQQDGGPRLAHGVRFEDLETILRFYERCGQDPTAATRELVACDSRSLRATAERLGTREVIQTLQAVAFDEDNTVARGGANDREPKGEEASILMRELAQVQAQPEVPPAAADPTQAGEQTSSVNTQSSAGLCAVSGGSQHQDPEQGDDGGADPRTGRRFSEDTVRSEASAAEEEENRVLGEILEKMSAPSDEGAVADHATRESEAEAVSATSKGGERESGPGAEDVGHDGKAVGADAEESKDDEDEIAALERRIEGLSRQVQGLDLNPEGSLSLRAKETIKVELQKAKYERDQLVLAKKNAGKKLAFNLIVVGCTGQGKSSSLNMLLNRNVCRVSGAQAQGTRGCQMSDGYISDDHFVSFIDTQGLGADTSVTDTELLSKIMMSTESISRLRIINNVLISFDTNTRATPATMANELTLMELFGEMRQSCFLVFTKWNTNAVQVEWNKPLRQWCRRWRRADSVEEIDEEPPSYADMYAAYTRYILEAMNNDEDAGAFSKMGTFLSFFEARVVWAYNLDMLQIADMEDGELEPHIVKLYHHYREKAIQCLRQGSTEVPVSDISFLKEDSDTLSRVATRLVEARDQKIAQLERIGLDVDKRKEMCNVFTDMSHANYEKISSGNYLADTDADASHMDRIASLAGFSSKSTQVGCSIS